MINTAIIGGTGVYDPQLFEGAKQIIQKTPYGQVQITTGIFQGMEVAFIPRHGSGHSIPPHLVNYRANIMALHQMGVRNIISSAAVGSLHFDFKPGEYVLPDQFLDFTKARPNTFYEGGSQGVTHCDMTVPYCSDLRKALIKTGQDMDINIHNGGVYVCSEGPRFETTAEIQMFKMLGGHLVGMTSVPEVCLARELGMCYACVAIVTNFAAGIAPGILTHSEVLEIMKSRIKQVREIMLTCVKNIPDHKECSCGNILKEIGVNK